MLFFDPWAKAPSVPFCLTWLSHNWIILAPRGFCPRACNGLVHVYSIGVVLYILVARSTLSPNHFIQRMMQSKGHCPSCLRFICWACAIDCNKEVRKELFRRHQVRLNLLSIRFKYNNRFGCDLALRSWRLKNFG